MEDTDDSFSGLSDDDLNTHSSTNSDIEETENSSNSNSEEENSFLNSPRDFSVIDNFYTSGRLSGISNSSISTDSFDTVASEDSTDSELFAPRPASDSDSSSDTIEYELPNVMSRVSPMQRGGGNVQEDDDEDVIFIPREIETIDLCTQAIPANPVPNNRINAAVSNDVIVITDSPAVAERHRNPSRISPRAQPYSRTSPRQRPIVNNLLNNLNDSSNNPNESQSNLNETQQKVAVQCPICYDSAIKNEPMSTKCGHIFCKQCLMTCLAREKKCPMCKTKLSDRRGTNDYHRIFL